MNENLYFRKKINRRAAIYIGIKVLVFSAIVGRIYKLQVIDSEKYKTLAEENRIGLVIHMPLRGLIYDMEGMIVASNKVHYTLSMTSVHINDLNALIIKLNEFIKLDNQEVDLMKHIYANKNSTLPHIIKNTLNWEEVARVSTNLLNLDGIEVNSTNSRYYPTDEKYFHITGYISSVTNKELEKDNFYSYPGTQSGKTGVEFTCEKFLRGFPGTEEVEVNSKGKIVRQLSIKHSVKGSDVHLTMNSRLQEYTISRLESKIGAAVVIDAKNGNIISSVSNPSINPNIFSKYMSEEKWDIISGAPNSPLLNKSVQGLYPPGSIFKIVVALAALKYGVINSKEKIFCSGKYELGNEEFHCWKKTGHSNVNFIKAIAESCDNYFYEISLRLGIEKIYKEAINLGVGKVYELFLRQELGSVPNKNWKKKVHGESWQKGETLNTGIGQGFVLLTPVEMAIMTAIIVNGGNIIRPNIIKIIKGNNEDIKIDNTSIESKINFYSKDHLNLIKKGMFNAVNSRKGTAWKSRIEDKNYLIGGKTGTSQVRKISSEERESGIIKNEDLPWGKRDHALFIGFAPYEKPKFVTVVVIEHGGSGSKIAAPIGRDLLVASREILLGEKTLTNEDSVKDNT